MYRPESRSVDVGVLCVCFSISSKLLAGTDILDVPHLTFLHLLWAVPRKFYRPCPGPPTRYDNNSWNSDILEILKNHHLLYNCQYLEQHLPEHNLCFIPRISHRMNQRATNSGSKIVQLFNLIKLQPLVTDGWDSDTTVITDRVTRARKYSQRRHNL